MKATDYPNHLTSQESWLVIEILREHIALLEKNAKHYGGMELEDQETIDHANEIIKRLDAGRR